MPTTPEIKQMKRFANYLFLFSCFSFIFCGSAFAQVSESDIGSETGLNESISRLTSTFEVKRAVIGLLIIAAITVVLFFLLVQDSSDGKRKLCQGSSTNVEFN